MLTNGKRKEFQRALTRIRRVVLANVSDAEAGLRFVTEDRESEVEERAQEESAARLMARLDDRGKQELWAIDAALRRLAEGTYGTCARCKKGIPPARLEAAPAVLHCARCARQVERPSGNGHATTVVWGPRTALPADLWSLSDSELAETLRELVRDDGRVDVEELRLTYRHGVVYMAGLLPSEAERQIVHKLLTDVEGLEEIVDRVRVNDMPWERDDSPDQFEALPDDVSQEFFESTRTADASRAAEEGIPYDPPGEPPPDEE